METISHTDLCKVGRPSWAYFSLDTCNTRVESPMSLHSVGQHRKSVEVWPRNRTGQLCWGGARPHPHREYCGHFKVSSSLWEMTLISSAGQKKMFTFFSHCSYSISASWLVSGGQDFTLKKWQLPQPLGDSCKDLKCTNTERVHEKDINCVVMSPNDKFIATGSHDRTAKVWTT